MARKSTLPGRIVAGRGTAEADAAISEARQGRLAVDDMLHTVLAAQVLVPLAEAPEMEGDRIAHWNPATITKRADGSLYHVAFTDPAVAADYVKGNPQHAYVLLVEASWLVRILPPGQGIAFNLGSENSFEWSAEGVAEHRALRTR
jgi:hypothetical protein